MTSALTTYLNHYWSDIDAQIENRAYEHLQRTRPGDTVQDARQRIKNKAETSQRFLAIMTYPVGTSNWINVHAWIRAGELLAEIESGECE